MSVVNYLYKWSDRFPKNSLRYWVSHVIYNFAKDIYNISKIRTF